MRVCRSIVDEGCADPDPWRGFCRIIERICELDARNRGLTEAFMSAFPDATETAAEREHVLKAIAELAGRAKDTGHLRPDFVLDDLILMLSAHKGIHAGSTAARVTASRRFAELAIRAFQTPDTAAHEPA